MRELFAKLQEKVKNCPCFRKGGCLCPEVEDCTSVRIPFFKMVLGPFSLLLDNPRAFFSLSVPYALLISVLSIIIGFGYLCLYSRSGAINAYCSNSSPVYLIYLLIKIWIVAVFSIKWCETALLKKPLTWKRLFLFDKRSLRLTLLIIVFMLLNATPLLSGYILYVRVPNPDWRVEIVFFAFVSLGFLVPFALLRFYSVVAFVIYGEPLPNLKELWFKNSGNNMNMLGGLFMIIIFAALVFSNLFRNFEVVAFNAPFYIEFAAEFLYNLLYLFMIVLFINYCCIQQQLIYGDKDVVECRQ